MADEPQPSTPQPSAAEALFFFSIVKNMKALSDIDWHAVAEDRGFKNAEVAKVQDCSLSSLFPRLSICKVG